jgi:hypothetical protein
MKWTVQAESMLGTMSDEVLAVTLGISKQAVQKRRSKLGIPAHRTKAGKAAVLGQDRGQQDLVLLTAKMPRSMRDKFVGLCKMKGSNGQSVILELVCDYLIEHGIDPKATDLGLAFETL